MKRRVLLTATLVILWTLALTTGLAQAQTTSNGPYYATPSWDQKLQCDTTATCPRFIVLSNWNGGAVLDRETGLVWEQSPSTALRSWANSLTSCNRLTVGNRRGWRLPTVQELASLTDPSVSFPGPNLPPGHPFSNNVRVDDRYFSATILTAGSTTPSVWGVEFSDGEVVGLQQSDLHLAWCVRSGQGVDPQ